VQSLGGLLKVVQQDRMQQNAAAGSYHSQPDCTLLLHSPGMAAHVECVGTELQRNSIVTFDHWYITAAALTRCGCPC
jgi:hypothetical protein